MKITTLSLTALLAFTFAAGCTDSDPNVVAPDPQVFSGL
jgi:hypothetical protein